MDEDISQLSCFCQPPVFQHTIYLVLGHRLFPLVSGQTDGPRSHQWEKGKCIPSLCQGPCGIANKIILLLLNPARSLSPVMVARAVWLNPTKRWALALPWVTGWSFMLPGAGSALAKIFTSGCWKEGLPVLNGLSLRHPSGPWSHSGAASALKAESIYRVPKSGLASLGTSGCFVAGVFCPCSFRCEFGFRGRFRKGNHCTAHVLSLISSAVQTVFPRCVWTVFLGVFCILVGEMKMLLWCFIGKWSLRAGSGNFLSFSWQPKFWVFLFVVRQLSS